MRKNLLMIGGVLLAASLMAAPAFAAETENDYFEDPAVDTSVDTELTDGVMTIRIKSDRDDDGSGFHWEAYRGDMGDASCVELITESDMEDGLAYAGSFRATDDGEGTIRLVYTDGHYAKEYMDFDVTTEDGKIVETIGGGRAYETLASDLAPFLEGVWQETGGNHFLEISMTDDGGFSFVISDGGGWDGNAVFYTMTGYYDALEDALVYWNGTRYLAAISDGSDETEPEAEVTPDGTGLFALDGQFDDEEDDLILTIYWKDDTFGNTDVDSFRRIDF